MNRRDLFLKKRSMQNVLFVGMEKNIKVNFNIETKAAIYVFWRS